MAQPAAPPPTEYHGAAARIEVPAARGELGGGVVLTHRETHRQGTPCLVVFDGMRKGGGRLDPLVFARRSMRCLAYGEKGRSVVGICQRLAGIGGAEPEPQQLSLDRPAIHALAGSRDSGQQPVQ